MYKLLVLLIRSISALDALQLLNERWYLPPNLNFQILPYEGSCTLVVLVLGVELPVVPLGPLGECLPRVVLHPSILPPNLFPSRVEQPALCVFCNFS